MAVSAELQAHLDTGLTTLCRTWLIKRRDGVNFGFTDHDCDLRFDGETFRADTGLTALALQQSTDLAVDNTEALGALSDASLSEEDILAGRFDGAEIWAWLVNWQDTMQNELVFRGTLGEITRIDGAFRAEVRGLAEALNRPIGRLIQKTSNQLLDDEGRPFDLQRTDYRFEGEIRAIDARKTFLIETEGAFSGGWFRHGSFDVLTGRAAGLSGVVKRDDVVEAALRRVELWESLRIPLATGDRVSILAGFDGRFETSRQKFDNALNFRGFPDIPEDDWIMTAAPSARNKNGGSRR